MEPPLKRRRLLPNEHELCESQHALPTDENNRLISSRSVSPSSVLRSAEKLDTLGEWKPDPDSPRQDDVCFGTLADITLSVVQFATFKPEEIGWHSARILGEHEGAVRLGSLHGGISGVFDNRYSKILKVLRDGGCHVQFDIEVKPESSQDAHAKRVSRKLAQHRVTVFAAATLYGAPELIDSVGTFLDSCGDVFLQLPTRCEFNVPYRNPQSLSRFADDAPMTFQLKPLQLSELVKIVEQPLDPSAALQSTRTFQEAATPANIRTCLLSHQKQALAFMRKRECGWDSTSKEDDLWKLIPGTSNVSNVYINTITGNVSNRPPPEFRGGLLADAMGLGKTLSTIALLASDTFTEKYGVTNLTAARCNLVVVPLTLLQTWDEELALHTVPGSLSWLVYHDKSTKLSQDQVRSFDIIITTYDRVASEWRRNDSQPSVLYTTEWKRIIIDEAHEIREARTLRAKAVTALKGRCRWAITGTPIQNRLQDLASLMNFLQVFPDHDLKRLRTMLESLNANGQLMQVLTCVCLRRSKGCFELPPRTDEMHYVVLNNDERQLYGEANLAAITSLSHDNSYTGSTTLPTYANILAKINSLRQICNLGTSYRGSDSQHSVTKTSQSIVQSLFSDLMSAGDAICSKCGCNLQFEHNEYDGYEVERPSCPSSFIAYASTCGAILCRICARNCEGMGANVACGHTPSCETHQVTDASDAGDSSFDKLVISDPAKVRALLQDMKEIGPYEKSVIFSYWTSTLDLIEASLKTSGISCIRVDGSMKASQRREAINRFRDDSSARAVLFSLRCGANGLNLTVANHVFLMEPQWNPMFEDQALDRVYRIGQVKPVSTVRYIVKDSLEENIRKLQREKRRLAEQAFALSKQRADWMQRIRMLLNVGD